MAERPTVGTHSPVPEPDDESVDGVVLFDPTSRRFDAYDEGPEQRSGKSRFAVAVLAVLAACLAGYQVFARLSGPASDPTPTSPIPMVSSGLEPIEPVLQPVDGGTSTGAVNSSITLAVRARGRSGAAIVDSTVAFAVLEGNAVLNVPQARTDSTGVARVSVALPSETGESVVAARLTASELETRIVVRAEPGPPTRVIALEGNGQQAEVAELVPIRPTVRVTDAAGNPVFGADVLFEAISGEGQAAPARLQTDSLGAASVMWRLGMSIGTQELRATIRGTDASVTFRANALGRPTPIEGAPRELERGPVIVARRDFVVGGSLVCHLLDGRARCRGASDRGQTAASGAVGLVAIAAGVSHACGLDASGAAVCWGANEGGQLGDGSRTDRSSAVPVRAEIRFSSLTAGSAHTCGIAGGGVAVCWGQNLSGQLGDGSRTDARFPRAVGGGILFSTLVAGWNHTCGLTANGNAFCWGPNSDGRLGDGSRLDRLTPTLVRGSVEVLAAGSNHTCGISGDVVLCWGDNRFGQVGDGTNQGRDQPTPVVGLPSRPTALAAGAVHTCALVADGSAYCWGQNLRGQLGIGTIENQDRAVAVTGGLRFRSIYAGGAVTCGIATDGTQYCWGMNQDGQLGDGTRENRTSPVRVGD